jgi:SAM-dependent methyltransferase
MPDPVSTHYHNLLARHYSWMFGQSFEQKVAEQHALLQPILVGRSRGVAVDLGSGPGFQTLALAQLGFSPVFAFDTSADLLQELASHIGPSNVRIRCSDLLTLPDHVSRDEAAAIVCMGDTLTHLPSREALRRLFMFVATALAPGGTFVLTWRDLTTELIGPARFIPVRSDDNIIMTCFLEYLTSDTVQVHDLIYTRTPSGWTLESGSYPKLRLSPAWVAEQLTAAGLQVRPLSQAGRLALAIADKP